MNRHQRRRAGALGNATHRIKTERTAFYQEYARHLQRVPDDAPYAAGTVNYVCVLHDGWCRTWETGIHEDCNCVPEIQRFQEPVRN
jgi:hypothetical protein